MPVQSAVSMPHPPQRIIAHSSQKQTHNVDNILQAEAKSGKHLMKKCQSEHYQQLFFNFLVKTFPISKLFSKVS